MRIKLSWIPFIVATFFCVVLNIYNAVFSSIENTSYLPVFIAGGLFLLTLIFSAMDKQTRGEYIFGKNIPAGIFLFLSGICLFAKSALQITTILQSSVPADNLFLIISSVLSILAGLVFWILGSDFVSSRAAKSKPVLMLIPVLWCSFEAIMKLVTYIKNSVFENDMTDIAFIVLTSLFLLNIGMLVCRISSGNPVKRSYIFGMPALVLIFSYTASNLAVLLTDVNSRNTNEMQHYLEVLMYFFLGVFMLFVLINLAAKVTPQSRTVVELRRTDDDEEGKDRTRSSRKDKKQRGKKDKDDKSGRRYRENKGRYARGGDLDERGIDEITAAEQNSSELFPPLPEDENIEEPRALPEVTDESPQDAYREVMDKFGRKVDDEDDAQAEDKEPVQEDEITRILNEVRKRASIGKDDK